MAKRGFREAMKGAKEKVLDALRTAARGALELMAGRGNVVLAGLGGIADELSGGLTGSLTLLAAIGGILLIGGVLLRFLPGISADLRQTAIRMIEGGAIMLALGGTGALILGGANWWGQQIAQQFGYQGSQAPTDYLNPWKP